MKIDSIEDVETIKTFIKTHAPKFFSEYIQQGIKMYRTVERGVTINVRQTQKEITAVGKIEQAMTPMLEPLLAAGGLASRVKNVLFTISKDPSKIVIKKPVECIVIPLGEYSMSFIEGVEDFNRIGAKTSGIGFELQEYGEMIEYIETYLTSDKKEYIKIMCNNNKQAAYSSIETYFDNSGISPADRDMVVDEAKRLWNILNPSAIGEHFKSEPSSVLKEQACEVIFNCDKYLLIDTKIYSWETLFPEYF